ERRQENPGMSTQTPQRSREAELLRAARAGDLQQFGELAEPYRGELQVHCYRILGSLQEAEDMVQESLLKAWRHIGSYEGRAPFRSWLYRIATNTCLDLLDSRRSRRLLPFQTAAPSDPEGPIAPPAPEIPWLEPLPDEWLEDVGAANPEARYSQYESISLSFLTALQVLPPRQRAVLILRDVLDFSSRETAEMLDLTIPSVNSALTRARKSVKRRFHGKVPERPGGLPADEPTKRLLEHFVQAWQAADVDALIALLKQDAILAMPPSPAWYKGSAAIGIFISRTIFGDAGMFPGRGRGRWRLMPVRANGSPAYGMYQRDEGGGYRPFGILSSEWEGDKVARITNFIDPGLPMRFGLPDALE
ncbi:MAG: sigma-70 family RNA polymerase sigma factor, partial [Bacteroidota bacterium]